jgi:hypothetical protein
MKLGYMRIFGFSLGTQPSAQTPSCPAPLVVAIFRPRSQVPMSNGLGHKLCHFIKLAPYGPARRSSCK